MGTIPAVPVFPAGLPAQGTAMQSLCTALTWCLSGRPLARLQQAVVQSVANATFTAITWDTKIVDRDSGWAAGANTRYTAQTPGIYLLAANVSWANNSTGNRSMYFQVTTSTNNPAGAGVTIQFGYCALSASASAGVCSQSLTPYMYDGDFVQVFAAQNSGAALSTSVTTNTAEFFTVDHVSG